MGPPVFAPFSENARNAICYIRKRILETKSWGVYRPSKHPHPPYFVQIKTDDTIRWTQFAWAKGGRGDLWSSPRPNEYNALIRMERIYKHDMEYLYSQLKCVLSPFNLCTELRAVNCLRILWPGSFTARQTPGTFLLLYFVRWGYYNQCLRRPLWVTCICSGVFKQSLDVYDCTEC